MNLFLWLVIGAAMGGVAGWRKAQRGRPRHWVVDVAFAAAGAVLGGIVAAAVDASFSQWTGLAAAAVGAGALLVVAGLRWRRAVGS